MIAPRTPKDFGSDLEICQTEESYVSVDPPGGVLGLSEASNKRLN